MSIQVTYIGSTTFKHGNDYGEAPNVTIDFGTGEQITSIFGRAGRSINSIGFTTSTGTVYGPWGGREGDAFSIPGPVYGLHGGLQNDVLGSLGTWTVEPPKLLNQYLAPIQPGIGSNAAISAASPLLPPPPSPPPPLTERNAGRVRARCPLSLLYILACCCHVRVLITIGSVHHSKYVLRPR